MKLRPLFVIEVSFILLSAGLSVHGQEYHPISGLQIVPEYPVDSGEVSIVCHAIFPNSDVYLDSTHIVNNPGNDTILIDACYSTGDLTMPGTSVDTFSLGCPGPGEYTVRFRSLENVHLNGELVTDIVFLDLRVYDESSFSFRIDSLSLRPVEPDTLHHLSLTVYTTFVNLDERLDSVDFDTGDFMNVRMYYSTQPGSGTHQRTDEVDFSLQTPGNLEMAILAINTSALGNVWEVHDTARLNMNLPDTPVQTVGSSHVSTSFKVYPNPANSFILVSFETETDPSWCIDLYTPDGRKIVHHQVRNNPLRIETNTCPPGIYTLVIASDRKIIGIEKVIVSGAE